MKVSETLLLNPVLQNLVEALFQTDDRMSLHLSYEASLSKDKSSIFISIFGYDSNFWELESVKRPFWCDIFVSSLSRRMTGGMLYLFEGSVLRRRRELLATVAYRDQLRWESSFYPSVFRWLTSRPTIVPCWVVSRCPFALFCAVPCEGRQTTPTRPLCDQTYQFFPKQDVANLSCASFTNRTRRSRPRGAFDLPI